MMRRTTLSYIASIAALLVNACALEKADDAAEFREVLPKAEAVRIAGPERPAGGGAKTAAAAARVGLLGEGAAVAPPSDAFWYSFTRDTRDGVNAITAQVLGSVWLLVHSQPTSLGSESAVWGPYTDALEPVTWRFRVTRVNGDEREYAYELEGRPRAATSDDAFRAVLTGTGYGPLSSKHGDGSFRIDVDALALLDPARHRGEAGVVTVDHDLPREVTRRLGALPRTIRARAEGAGGVWFDVTSEAREDQTGMLVVDSHGDIDPAKATLLEDVHVVSRWRSDGAGRADIAITGGDLPATTPLVTAVECWSTDFSRAHYSDSVGFEPVVGDASACAYGALEAE